MNQLETRNLKLGEKVHSHNWSVKHGSHQHIEYTLVSIAITITNKGRQSWKKYRSARLEIFGPAKFNLSKQMSTPVAEDVVVPVVASLTDLKIIDWDEAMVQVGGDREFLNEVLQDLLAESRTAEEEIGEAIKTSDFSGVMKAAHRIKGSASYLCCEALRDISLKLQDAGHDGTTSPKDPEQLLIQIDLLFDHFVECLKALRTEIEEKSE